MHSLFLGNITIYWIINLFLFAVILFCSYNISYLRNNQSFRLYALIIIVFYTIIEGLRWDRGVGYYGYYLAVMGEKEEAASELGYALLRFADINQTKRNIKNLKKITIDLC